PDRPAHRLCGRGEDLRRDIERLVAHGTPAVLVQDHEVVEVDKKERCAALRPEGLLERVAAPRRRGLRRSLRRTPHHSHRHMRLPTVSIYRCHTYMFDRSMSSVACSQGLAVS